ncbi:hypothetical protein NIE88_06775 [Sporolactobacillus shoreicorticis]|uniref:Yip1 domain-containing protein n=1 Tax=Sporolactobacillus shoreicorticis TaxID=1923877 RepID=A0ABW5S716_9BACL|nr:hypothetical protein [Sporolactobacillus shoreicorticis]MCO7125472.1 hypothetical protein [Sporolactobacillus shoreicorticis]
MICAPVFFNHATSPVFMFYFLPPLFVLAAAANLIAAMIIYFLATKFFSIKVRGNQALRMIFGLWLIDLIAYLFGSLFLVTIGMLGKKFHVLLIDYDMIYSSLVSTLLFASAVLLSALIIYVLNYFYLSMYLTKKQAARVALLFAILTAPYPFLIPASFLY